MAEVGFSSWSIRAVARRDSTARPSWRSYAAELSSLLHGVGDLFNGFSGWHVHADRDRLGPQVSLNADELSRFIISRRMKDDRGELMVGGASQVGLSAVYGQDEDGGQLFFSANLGEVDDERPLDYVQLRVRDRSGPLIERSPEWVLRLLHVHVVSFSPRHAYVRDGTLTRKFAGGGILFRLGNYTYIPRPLEAKLVPSGVRQVPMGEGAVLVLPNERPDALLPLCRELAGPIAELVGW